MQSPVFSFKTFTPEQQRAFLDYLVGVLVSVHGRRPFRRGKWKVHVRLMLLGARAALQSAALSGFAVPDLPQDWVKMLEQGTFNEWMRRKYVRQWTQRNPRRPRDRKA